MAAVTTITELRRMHVEDLGKEIRDQRNLVAQLRLAVKMQKDKDSAKYRREKKQLARMETVRSEMTKKARSVKSSEAPKAPKASKPPKAPNP